jgi:hypothetical protein
MKSDNKTKFTKSQIVKSKTYENYRDFLNGVLKDDKQYTKDEINKLISSNYGVK